MFKNAIFSLKMSNIVNEKMAKYSVKFDFGYIKWYNKSSEKIFRSWFLTAKSSKQS